MREKVEEKAFQFDDLAKPLSAIRWQLKLASVLHNLMDRKDSGYRRHRLKERGREDMNSGVTSPVS